MNNFQESNLNNCKVIELPKVHNRAGNLTALNNNLDLPFEVKRVYYLYDIPGGEKRGGHAHRELHQLVIAASGSFNVYLNDGFFSKSVTLNSPNQGLIIVPGIWRELSDFSSGAICLVLASMEYNGKDYIRDFNHFIKSR